MKLLIVTQAVDTENPVLGFFVRWIEEFAKRCERIEVICLKEGKHHLPAQVRVHSLGKEKGASRAKYVFNFYTYIWNLRRDYDAVFVHMNEEYILLGAPLWRLTGKKILFWRNHPNGNMITAVAVILSDKVFCTSVRSYTARFLKTRIMPVGIDTSFFADQGKVRTKNSLLMLGRIAPVKKQEIIIDALALLHKEKIPFIARIVGGALPKDAPYYALLREKVLEANMSDSVSFSRLVPHEETVSLYNESEILINATPNGSMDKTIFEAMACGMLPLVSNEDLRGNVDEVFLFKEQDAADLVEKIKRLFFLGDEQKNEYRMKHRDFIVAAHSLDELAARLFADI